MNEKKPYLSVTALTRNIKRMFDKERTLREVWVRGELSNFKRHSRGHMYFTLKDQNARVQSVMFATQNRTLNFRPESGMKVLIRGEVSVYEPYGQYQLYAKEMQPDGIGNLYLAYEQLKKKLEAEGLFSVQIKKTLPVFPLEIAVITSPTGAAVRDIFTTVKRRFPVTRMTLLPALVQGKQAASSIAAALHQANELGHFDVIIVGRGGGSIEELWAFNEEIVARKIFESTTPIISAIGHETDYTIADFVADLRAPTPTGAGELAVPHIDELSQRVTERADRLKRGIVEKVSTEKEHLKRLKTSYAFRYPSQLVRQKEQELDKMLERIDRETKRNVQQKNDKWLQLKKDMIRNHPKEKLQRADKEHLQLAKTMKREMEKWYKEKDMVFRERVSKLNALSPLNVMERGFSLAYSEDGTLVKTVSQVEPSDAVHIRLKDGKLDCQVWGIEESVNHERK
jgi:exodeoxyribonuclease VII large subunit